MISHVRKLGAPSGPDAVWNCQNQAGYSAWIIQGVADREPRSPGSPHYGDPSQAQIAEQFENNLFTQLLRDRLLPWAASSGATS